MTSLALQLKQLAVPHTAVSLVADKKRVSLLFDPKEAANLDREAVFALGSSGLDKLKKTDEEFHKFEALLFNEGSSTWERSLQSAEINQTLDKQIEQFLVRLSPYFLLKAAHRTLEWLIFKYHIHLYNVDPLIQCALPYHDSKIFVQLISLLKISLSTNKWHWLHPSATSGTPLPKAVIIAHCRKNHAFLRFLYNMVENFIKEHGADSANLRSVVSLYTSAVMGCVCEKQYISEALLAGLVPILILGIRSRCAELKVGTYTCVTLLATQTELEPEFVQNLLHTLFKYPAESLVREVLSCLIAIFHTQNIEDIKDSTYSAITKLPGFIEQFSLINEEFECSKVLLLLMNHIISDLSTDFKSNQDLCINIIHEIKFSSEVAEQLACTLLSHILKLASARKRWKSIATRLLPIMEQRYPDAMDSAIKSIYKSLSSSQDEVYHEILQCSFRDSDSRSDNSRSFLLTINHPSCERRCISIRTLRNGLKDTDKQLPEVISEVIVAHFLDDDMNTVLEALKLTTHISQSLKTKDLVSHLLEAFDNAVSRNWFDVKSAALEHLTHGRFTCDVDIQIMSHMFPYVCLRKVKDKETAIEILTSKLFLKYLPDHEDWRSSLEACRKVRSFNNAVVQKLSSWMLEMKYFLRKSLLDMKLHEKSCAPNPTCSIVIVMLAGTKACCHGNGRETALISMLVQLLKDSSKYVKEDSEVSDVELPYEDLLHGFDTNVLVQAIKWCTHQLGKLSQDVQGIFLDSTDYVMQCHIHLLNSAVEITQQTTNPAVCQIWVELIQNYVTEDAISPCEVHQILCWFILYGYRLTSIHDVTVTPVLQIASIGMLQKHLSRKTVLEAVEIERSPVFVTLFSCISHPQKCMREKAVDILRKIKKQKLSKWKVILPVLRAIVTQREELINDETFSAHFLLPIIQTHPETLTYFMTVVTSDDYPLEVKERMMYLIQDVQLHDVETCEKFCSIGISILSKERVSLPVERSMLAIIFNGFVKKNAMHMQSDSRMFKLLATAIRTDWRAFNIPEDVDSPLDMILRKITRKLFAKIPSQKEKKRIITLLLDAVMRSRSAKLTQSITGKLTDLDLQYADINHYLPSGESSQEVTVREKRKSQPQEVDWERVTLLLEILQDRTSFTDAESIMMAAFLVLQRLLEDTRIGEESEYKKRLALTVIHNLARKWADKQQQPKLKTIRMEVLTQCLRKSTILTQQQTLLVVTQVCFFYPEYVLDNVMSIFTFMGSGILRLDNIYSFNVIIEVVKKLLPALLEAHRNNNEIVLHIENDSSENAKESVIVTDVVQVFVEARPVIPRHRALSIFEALVSTIGPRDFLWQVVALLIQGGARGSAVTLANEDQIIVKRTDDEDEDSSSAYLKDSSSFAIELTLMFTVDEQLHSLYTMLQFLIKLTDIQAAVCSNKTAKPDTSTQAIIQHLNPKQLRLFQFYLTKHIANVLGDTVFIEKVVEAMSVTHMLNFDLLVEKTMSYNSVTTKHCNQSSQKHHTSYWSSLQKRTNAILNKLNYLLPLDKLLSVLEQLLLTGALAVKRKTLELLAEKLRSLSVENLTEAEEKQLLNMTELIVKEGVDQSTEFMKQTGKHSSELLHYHQLMLYNAKLLAKHLGAKYPNVFKPFMAICVKLIGPQTQTRVLCTALLGVAQLCSVLSQHVIVYLKDFVPAIHEIMKEHNLLKGNETVLSSVLTALHHLYGSLASFLSPYLKDTLILISSLSTIVNLNDPQKQLTDPVQRLRATRRLIGQGINPRVLLPILGETFDELLTTDASSVSSLLELIKDHMEHITKEDIDNQHHTIFDLFYKTLDVRNSADHMSHEDISIIESTVIDAFVILVKKMSEDSFKPEFLKVYDWCCREDDMENRNRKLTFFALTYRLSQTLTSLFNLFVGVTFGAACKTLDANNSKLHKVRYYGKGEKAKKKSCALLSVILKSLDSCLSFDADDLITPEMYKIMGTPLVNQLENLLGGDEEYNNRTVSALIPCLSQFAVVSKHAGKSNHFNAAVGEKTKSGHPKVRIAAIRVMEATALKMGHEYMKLLPEIAPLLHELMEDENEEVEDQCQRAVNVMEQAVGENLRNYF